jgi:hypothetical protein
MEKIEILIEKIGGHNKYQIILSVILTISGMFNDFTVLLLTYMVSPPIADYVNSDNNKVTEPLYDQVCNQKYEINEDRTNHNWSYEFKLYCDSSLYLTLLQTSLLFGSLIGLILLRFLLANYDKTKLSKAANSLFTITTCLIFFKNYWVTIIMTMLHGICHIINFITRTTIIAELTDKNYRSYFISFQFFSGIVMGLMSPFIYNSNINWLISYGSVMILNTINSVFLFVYLSTTPIFTILNNDLKNTIQVSLYIAKINNKIEEDKFDISTTELYNSALNVKSNMNEYLTNRVRKESDMKSDHQSLNNNKNSKENNDNSETSPNDSSEEQCKIISNVREFVNWIEKTYFSQIVKETSEKNLSSKSLKKTFNENKDRKLSDNTNNTIITKNTKKSLEEPSNNEELMDQSCATEIFDLKYSKENNSFFTPTNYYDQSNIDSVKEHNTEVKTQYTNGKLKSLCYNKECLNLWILAVSAILFNISLYSVVFEVEKFTNNYNFNLMMSISYIVGSFLFPTISWLSNRIKVGRKGTHLLVLTICLLLRTSYFMIDIGLTIQVYMAVRALINANQIPVQALMSETMSNKKRIKLYSIIYIIKSVTTMIVPVMLNYLSDTAFNICICIFLSLSILFGIFVEETNQKRLTDT